MRLPVARIRAPQIHAAAARKRLGQSDQPKTSRVTMWTGTQNANSRMSAAMRAAAIMIEERLLPVSIERDAVELHPMVDETIAELLRDPFLKILELLVDELDHVARFDVDQVIVMRFG